MIFDSGSYINAPRRVYRHVFSNIILLKFPHMPHLKFRNDFYAAISGHFKRKILSFNAIKLHYQS